MPEFYPKAMTPSYSGQRANGWPGSMQMPIFKGVSNAYPLAKLLANGPPDDPPGIRKKAACVSSRSAIHFPVRICPGLTAPACRRACFLAATPRTTQDNFGQPGTTCGVDVEKRAG